MSKTSTKMPKSKVAPASEARGPVLDMLRELLKAGDNEKVLALVAQLLSRNSELETRLQRRRAQGSNESEGISSGQLELFLAALQQEAQQALNEANEKLKEAAKPADKPAAPPKPPRQPPVRRPAPSTCDASTTSSRCPTTSGRVQFAARNASASATTSPR